MMTKSLLIEGEHRDNHEEWRVSPTLPEYKVSSLGRVKRIPYLKPMPRGGYRTYGGKAHYGVDKVNHGERRMVMNFRGKNYKIARLVCEAFNGPPTSENNICMHLDEDYTNNRPENLSWGTQKDNLNADGFLEYCRSRTGDNHPRVKSKRST